MIEAAKVDIIFWKKKF